MPVDVSIEDRVGVITLDRPDTMNAITPGVVEELGVEVAELRDAGVRAVVLTGSGGSFCAGADLNLVREALDGKPHTVLAPLVDALHALIRTLRGLPLPVVAAVDGPAVGAGMGLALAADLRLVGESARLIPGYIGIGASPDGGVSHFLTRALGAAMAGSIILRNTALPAHRMVELGLAEEVVETGATVGRAIELARDLAACPPGAVLRTRSLVDEATTQRLATQLDRERERVVELWSTADFREGVSAFLAKREPEFQGR